MTTIAPKSLNRTSASAKVPRDEHDLVCPRRSLAPAANAVTRQALLRSSASPAPTIEPALTAVPASAPRGDGPVAARVRSSVVAAPGGVPAALRGHRLQEFTRQRPRRPIPSGHSRATQEVLAAPRKRDGRYGWQDFSLAPPRGCQSSVIAGLA